MSNKYKHGPLIQPSKSKKMGVNGHNLSRGQDEAKLDFSEIWSTIREGKWIILLTCVLVAGAVTAFTLTMDPTYESSSIVFVEAQGTTTPGLANFGVVESRALTNELGILGNSMELATRVAERIKETAEAVGSAESFPILESDGDEELTTLDVAQRLLDRVSFNAYADQDMIRIRAESPVPEEAAVIANRYAEEYEKYSREVSRESVTAAREFLEEQVNRRREELDELENQWEDYAQAKDVVTLGPQGERLVAEVSELEAQRDNAEFKLEQEKKSLEFLREEIERIEPGLAKELEANREASSLESQIQALEQRIAQLKAEAEQYYAINGPELRGNEEQIPELAEIVKQIEHFEKRQDELSGRLIGETLGAEGPTDRGGQLGYVNQLKTRIIEKQMAVRELQEQIAALNNKIRSYDGRLSSIPRQTIELRQLERRRAVVEKWYNTFLQELQKTMIAEESQMGYVKIVRSAVIPTLPVRPNVQQNIILGIVLGLGLGIGLAFLKKVSNTRLQHPEDLQARGYSLVGVIPPMDRTIKAEYGGKETVEIYGKERSTRLMTALDPWSPISENYRLVRTNIEFAQQRGTSKVFLITSPEMGDGKTVTAANLAVVLAQAGKRTLIIDTDLRRSNTHNMFGEADSPGVAEILKGDLTPDPDCCATGIKNLHFIPAGHWTDSPPAEVLGSQAMRRFIEEMRQHFDAIIIDSPPVLAVTDPVVLAQQCDVTIVVTAANKTEVQALDVTSKTLGAVGVSIDGVIFNRYDAQKSSSQGYGYGYGYTRYGESYGKKKIAAPSA